MLAHCLQRLRPLLGAHDAVVDAQRHAQPLLQPSDDRVEDLRSSQHTVLQAEAEHTGVSAKRQQPRTVQQQLQGQRIAALRHCRNINLKAETKSREPPNARRSTSQQHRQGQSVSVLCSYDLVGSSTGQAGQQRTWACRSASGPGSSRQQALSVCRYWSIVSITCSRGFGCGQG